MTENVHAHIGANGVTYPYAMVKRTGVGGSMAVRTVCNETEMAIAKEDGYFMSAEEQTAMEKAHAEKVASVGVSLSVESTPPKRK